MQQYSGNQENIYVDFGAFIANLYNVDYKSGLQMIENLQNSLMLKRQNVNNNIKYIGGVPFYGTAIMDLYSQMYELFCDFLEKFKETYIRNSKTE